METSPYAYEHVLRKMRYSLASDQKPSEATGRISGHIFQPLLWLYRLIIRLTVGEAKAELLPAPDYKDEGFVSKYSRSTRKILERNRMVIDIRAIRRRVYIDHLLFKGLSPCQKKEKQVRLSGLGRICIYGLRYWGTRLQARARLTCYDHGWWRMPHTSALRDGMWDAQLPPN